MPAEPPPPRSEPGRLPTWAWAGGLFALVAFLAELGASLFGRSDSTGPLAWLAPVGWPSPLRAAWWLLAATGIVALYVGRRRAGERPNRFVAAGTATLFAAFAVGVAIEAPWATWH